MIVYLQMIEGEEEKLQFAALYETYRGLMFYTANNILHNAQDAEDAVHQAFISLAENFSKIKAIECPQTRAFVVIIVERKAIDLLRKRSRQAEVGMNEAVHGIDIPLPGDNGLADAMASLPAHDHGACRFLRRVVCGDEKAADPCQKLTQKTNGGGRL